MYLNTDVLEFEQGEIKVGDLVVSARSRYIVARLGRSYWLIELTGVSGVGPFACEEKMRGWLSERSEVYQVLSTSEYSLRLVKGGEA